MNKAVIAFILLVSWSVSFAETVESATLNTKHAVVMIDKGHSGNIEKVNGRRVTSQGMFKALVDLHRAGASQVALMIQERIPFKQINDLGQLLTKAGFVPAEVRVFVFGSDKDWLQELTFSPSRPFSEKVDGLKLANSHVSNAETAIVMIDSGQAGIIQTINNRIPSQGLLRGLINVGKEGATQLVLLVHEKVTLKQLGNITGVADKAGFVGASVRVFVFDTEKKKMWKIDFSKAYIFSEKIDDLKLLHPPANFKNSH